jgi:hypothetical protein
MGLNFAATDLSLYWWSPSAVIFQSLADSHIFSSPRIFEFINIFLSQSLPLETL